MNSAIIFDNDTCPRCGESVLKSKNLYGSKQLNTIDTYVCEKCGLKFPIEWKNSPNSTDYSPSPLYYTSVIENFKRLFYEEEDL